MIILANVDLCMTKCWYWNYWYD